jgi:hypothetical protein
MLKSNGAKISKKTPDAKDSKQPPQQNQDALLNGTNDDDIPKKRRQKSVDPKDSQDSAAKNRLAADQPQQFASKIFFH